MNDLDTPSKVVELVTFYVAEHNSKLPHSAFRGQTSDEMFRRTGDGLPQYLEEKRHAAQRARLEENRTRACSTCRVDANGGTEAA